MADSDKNILITPNRGLSSEPKIEFTGKDGVPITLYSLDTGSLSFEGASGQLFSISDTFSGTIFSVNDISGIPSIEVLDTGEIRLAEYGGNVGIGLQNPQNKLVVSGNLEVLGSITASVLTGDNTIVRTTGTQTIGGSKTFTSDVTISKTAPSLKLFDTNTSLGNYPRIDFDTNNNQGVSLLHTEFDGELPTNGYGLILTASNANNQFPTGELSFSVTGQMYAGSTSVENMTRVILSQDTSSMDVSGAENLQGFEPTDFVKNYNIADTASTSQWVELGTFNTSNPIGWSLLIKIVSNNGYSANDAQNAELLVRFKTSNNSANQSGFYGDAQSYRIGQNENVASIVRIVQNSTTSYTFYAYFGAFSANSFYEVSCRPNSTWVHTGTLYGTTAPTGTTLDATEHRILDSENDFIVNGDWRMTSEVFTVGIDGSGEGQIVLNSSNAGSPQIEMGDNNGDMYWSMGGDDADNSFKIHGSISSMPTIHSLQSPHFELKTNGDLIISGSVTSTDGFIGTSSWAKSSSVSNELSSDGSLRVYFPTTSSITIEGSSGQLFSVDDNFSGSIFAVSDVSGIPSIEVFDTGEIRLAEFGGNIGIGGVTNPQNQLVVSGGVSIIGGLTASYFESINGANISLTPIQGLDLGGVSLGSPGNYSVQIHNSVASGQSAVAVGNYSTASAASSVAIGDSAKAQGNSSIVIGRCENDGTRNIIVGNYTFSNYGGSDNIVMGTNIDVSFGGNNNVALGIYNVIAGSNVVSIGDSADAQGDNAVSIGRDSYAGGTDALAIGRGSNALLGSNISIGNSDSIGVGTISIGNSSEASSFSSVSIGSNSKSNGTLTVSIGAYADAGAANAISIGGASNSAGQSGVSVGANSSVESTGGVSIGASCLTRGSRAIGVGYLSEASGSNSIALGSYAESYGENSLAVGHRVEAYRDYMGEKGIWQSPATRKSGVRLSGVDNMVNFSIDERSTKYDDGGAIPGFEASGTIMRESYAIRRNGTTLYLDLNVGGNVYTLNLGTAT